jgi:hypothetical protein
VCLVFVSAQAQTRPSVDFDHLIPIAGVIEADYEALLEKRFFSNSNDVLRITVITSSASGEKGLSIYPNPNDSQTTMVACAKAEQNLGSAAESKRTRSQVRTIKIHRVTAPLPTAIATKLVDSVKGALRRVAPPAKTERVILDASYIEVSVIDRKGSVFAKGVLDPIASGRRVDALRRLVELLEVYCEATPERRPKLLLKLADVAGDV